MNRHTRSVVLAQKPCHVVDHGAESVLNAQALALSAIDIGIRGTFPSNQRAKEIILATGLPRYLKLTHALPEPHGFMTYPLTNGWKQASSAHRSSAREVEATRLIDYINRCLKRHKYQLNPRAEDWLHRIVGEVLGNAEDHSGRRDWWISGYLRDTPNAVYDDCHITVFNYGNTICETLQSLPSDSTLRQEIEALEQIHAESGFYNRVWTPEDLWTLYALQEQVSRFNASATPFGLRGTGTAEMIEFFQRLGTSASAPRAPRMSLISGHTQVTFNGRYHMRRRRAGAVRTITFNEEQDLNLPPDPRNVRHLNGFFPGTILTLDFYLDPENLDRQVTNQWNQHEPLLST